MVKRQRPKGPIDLHLPGSNMIATAEREEVFLPNSITPQSSCTLFLQCHSSCTKATTTATATIGYTAASMSTKLFLVLLLSCSSMSYTLSTTATAASSFAATTTTTATSTMSRALFKPSNPQQTHKHPSYRQTHRSYHSCFPHYHRSQQTKLHSINTNPNYNEYHQEGSNNYPRLCQLRRSNNHQRGGTTNHNDIVNNQHHHYNNALLNRILSGRKSIQQRLRRNTKQRATTTFLGKHGDKNSSSSRRRGSFYYRIMDDDDCHEYFTTLTSTSASSYVTAPIIGSSSSTSTSVNSSPSATTASVASLLPSSKRTLSTHHHSSSYQFSNEFSENHDFDIDDIELYLKKKRNRNSKKKKKDSAAISSSTTSSVSAKKDRKELFYLSLRASYTPISSTRRRKERRTSKQSGNILSVSRGGSQSDHDIDDNDDDEKDIQQRYDERIYNSRPVPPLTSTILGSTRQLKKKSEDSNNNNDQHDIDKDVNNTSSENDTSKGKSHHDAIRPLCNSDISSNKSSSSNKKKTKLNQKKPKLQILRYSQHRQQQTEINNIDIENNRLPGTHFNDKDSLFSTSLEADSKSKNVTRNNNNLINTKIKFRHHKLLTEEEQTQAKIQWAAKYTSLNTLRQTFGRNRNKFWGDFDSKTTRRLYHTILPRALLGLYDIGLWSPKEVAPLAFEARLAAKKYARERSVVPSRIIAMVYDGFRMWRDWGTWSVEGMSWEQVWDKYETQILEEMIEDCHYDLNSDSTAEAFDTASVDNDECCIIDLNEESVQEEITAQICLRILERSCATNGVIDKLFLEGKNELSLKRDDDVNRIGGKGSKFKRSRRKRLRRKNAERDLTRIRNRLEKDMQELLQIEPSSKK